VELDTTPQPWSAIEQSVPLGPPMRLPVMPRLPESVVASLQPRLV
jgi:hypothetical protein